eukprot:11165167-Lingulodinium_polyedra.AAC.1
MTDTMRERTDKAKRTRSKGKSHLHVPHVSLLIQVAECKASEGNVVWSSKMAARSFLQLLLGSWTSLSTPAILA